MKNIQAIFEYNNNGVKHISNGSYSAAKKAFRAALVVLKECEDQQQEAMTIEQKSSCHPQSSPLTIDTCTIPSFRRRKRNDDGDIEHYIFRNAVLIDFDPKSDIDADVSLYQRISAGLTAIIIFNLSLTSHYNAECYGWSTSELGKVVKMYSKAWKALHNDSWLMTHHQIYRDTIVLAMLNNMGVIFHKLANFDKSRCCFKALRNVFLSKPQGVLELRPDAHNGIMMNVLFGDQPNAASAA